METGQDGRFLSHQYDEVTGRGQEEDRRRTIGEEAWHEINLEIEDARKKKKKKINLPASLFANFWFATGCIVII